nr:MAG TPA: hypothetical protein [Caudoviricetes sp.]
MNSFCSFVRDLISISNFLSILLIGTPFCLPPPDGKGRQVLGQLHSGAAALAVYRRFPSEPLFLP